MSGLSRKKASKNPILHELLAKGNPLRTYDSHTFAVIPVKIVLNPTPYMKKSLLIFTLSLLFVSSKSFAQTPPTSLWADVATTEWYNASENVFTLTTAEEFAGLATLVNNGNNFAGRTINIAGDIDLGEHLWTPIGKSYTVFFSGIFDGGGYTLSNLFIELPSEDNRGLFGYCTNAKLSNIMLSDPYVRGFQNTGSLVGNFSDSEMVNCHATGVDVVSTDSNIGGLVGGLVTNSIMERCSSQGVVQGLSQVGGLVGSVWNLTEISESYSEGSVSAGHIAGGLIGLSTLAFQPNRDNIVINCYTRANVSVLNGRAGGLAGGSDANLFIYNSYATGTATGPELTGGFIGAVGSVTAEDCYWDMETSEHDEAVGGWLGAPGEVDVTGKETPEMKTSEMVDLLNQGQSVSPWTIDPDVNDGYPGFEGMTVSAPTIQVSNVEVSVYPNLVDAHIQIEAIANLKSYSIYDVSGKIITQGTLMGNAAQIDAQNLASGAYILLIDTDQGSASQKFMKK